MSISFLETVAVRVLLDLGETRVSRKGKALSSLESSVVKWM